MKTDIAAVIALAASLFSGTHAQGSEARLISMDDQLLEVRVVGTKTPVVVIEAGFGDHAGRWRDVQDRLAEFATVITYSRAGYGKSGTSPTRPTPLHVAAKLRSLLRMIGAEGRYVLLGHSWGGLLMRVFAAQYPESVAGLILIDGSHERQYQEYSRLSSTFWEDVRPILDQAAAKIGGGAPAELEVMWDVYRRGTLPEANPLPTVPMVVITVQRPDPSWTGGTEAGLSAWRRLHQELCAHHKEVLHLITDRSGHNVHRDRPQLVVDAVRHLIGLLPAAE